jgi:hypothetical protein
MNSITLWIGGGVVVAILAATFRAMWSDGSPRTRPWSSGSDDDDGGEGHGGHGSGGGSSDTSIGPTGGDHH